MAESPEELYARIVEQVGPDGRLPMSSVQEWEIFPWEVVEGELRPKVVPPPLAVEPMRAGEADQPCGTCAGDATVDVIWENEHWFVSRHERSGLPLLLMLHSRQHLDFPELDDELAAEYGRISVRLTRIMEGLPHVGRVHVDRWGDGGAHLHVWFVARPARFAPIRGSLALEWDEMLPQTPEQTWQADCREVARRLATHDGEALV